MKNKENYAAVQEQISNHLNSIEIPKELEACVNQSIQEGLKKRERKVAMKRWMRTITASAAMITVGFVGTANLSPTFAQSLSDIPVLNRLVEVVTFKQFSYEEDTYTATLEAPVIEGLQDNKLQEALNHKYIEENKELYKQFEEEVASMQEFGETGHLGTQSGFEVKTNNDEILSIGRYVVNMVGSSSTTMTYDTIDKKNEILITLPSLFKDSSYTMVIADNIKEQMRERMAQDSNQMYWIAGDENSIDGFDTLDPEQEFYITEEGKLVISFDKYTVAPGAMGVQEFEIPTEVLADILVSNIYIK